MSWPPARLDHSTSAVSLHHQLCTSPAPNAFSLRLPVYSTLNIAVWRAALASYHDAVVVDFLEFGWPINYVSPQPPTPVRQNHPSALLHPSDVNSFIAREVSLSATAGPFQANPLSCSLMLSPLLTVPKKESTSRRIVMDLSFPPEQSVNSGIPTDTYLGEPYKLRLPGVDALVALVQTFGSGSLLFKKDLRRAYRQLPIDPRDYHFMGYSWDNLIFFDTVFAFGLRTAAMACQRSTNCITHLFSLRGYSCTNYIDDFGGCDTPDRAFDAFHQLQTLFLELGLESSPEKDSPPATNMIFLGILFDTVDMTLSIPSAKIQELLARIQQLICRRRIAHHDLQSLLGLMSFVTACVHPARIFMSSLLNGLRGLRPNKYLLLSAEIKADLQWWLKFLVRFNGISLIPPPLFTPDVLFTDACLSGVGGHFRNQCFHAQFPHAVVSGQQYNINIKELLAIIVALRLWGGHMQGSRILLRSDNLDAVLALNNRRSRSPLVQQCLRVVWYICASYDMDLHAEHIPGYCNVAADLLSRWGSDPTAFAAFFDLPAFADYEFADCSPQMFDLSYDITDFR